MTGGLVPELEQTALQQRGDGPLAGLQGLGGEAVVGAAADAERLEVAEDLAGRAVDARSGLAVAVLERDLLALAAL